MNGYETLALDAVTNSLRAANISYSLEEFDETNLNTYYATISINCTCISTKGISTRILTPPECAENMSRMLVEIITRLQRIGCEKVKIKSKYGRDKITILLTSGEPLPPKVATIIPSQIIYSLDEELKHQQAKKFGGNTEEFDKTNTQNDWVAYITAFAGRAAKVDRNTRDGCDFRANMVKVAALTISAINAYDKGYL